MALIDELEAKVRRAAAALPARYRRPVQVGKVYEAYCWVLTLEAVRLATGRHRIAVQRLVGGAIVLPGRPVPLDAAYRWSYGDFSTDGHEVHASVQATGRSGVAHELDVSVLDAAASARSQRASDAKPIKSQHARIAIEAKCYSRPLDLAIGREVVGLNSDTYWHIILASNMLDPAIDRILRGRPRKVEMVGGVRPAAPGRETLLVNTLRSFL